ncbi:SRPBCC domain-containing protein [Agaribacter marinus]|uniref:Activator of Hsp90 ATPase homologue 1/2-like C-terminal domain-containing protein n=1 Tax=Agaribacter marinus TaxID=1431249 RepID=A0AA37SXD7_9ALTE|nr:SRPBCC domain-containing protein [Agaribacter marinus]GLR71517.1 hypothetical protein GCM10007852_24250 [Agaribacter marinus]
MNDVDVIERVLDINKPIGLVWQAITSPEEICQWFGSACSVVLEEGAEGYFEWQEECEGQFAMKIIRIEKPTYFAWRWMLKQNMPFNLATSTLVEWRLTETDTGTRLKLRESGFASAKHLDMNKQGWEQELTDLQEYLK